MRATPVRIWLCLGLLAACWILPADAAARSRRKRGKRSRATSRHKARPRAVRPAGSSRKQLQRARRHFFRGKRFYRREQFRQAIAAFQQAFAVLRHRNILLNISICYAELGDPVAAITQLRAAERMVGAPAEQILDKREYAKLLRMKKKVAILAVEAPDPRAAVVINGQPAVRGRVDRVLLPGRYRVELRLDGRGRMVRTFNLSPGQQVRWQPPAWLAAPQKGSGGRRRRLHVGYFIASAAVTVVAGAALIGTALRTRQLGEEFNDTGDPALRSEGVRYRTATNVLIGVTAAAAAATVVLALFTEWRGARTNRERAHPTVVPFTGGGAAGLVVTGRF